MDAVRFADQQIVAAYNSLGLASNDPNTVGDQAAVVIGHAFAIYSEEFFLSVIANLANSIGRLVTDVVNLFTQEFQVALDAASQLVSQAGYALASWVEGIGNFLTEAFDYSCVVEISNQGNSFDLVRTDSGINHGSWSIEPPDRIPAGGVGRFWLKDPKPSTDGSEGWVNYSWTDGSGRLQVAAFSFADPVFSSNAALCTSPSFTLFTKSWSVNNNWGHRGDVTGSGHPFFVAFVWGQGSPP